VDWLQFTVQWLHVLSAITWFGGNLYQNLVAIPAILKLPAGERQIEAAGHLTRLSERVIGPAAYATIVLGIIRGTVFGPIRSVDALTTTYGLTWLLALVIAVSMVVYVRVLLAPRGAALIADAAGATGGPGGGPTSAFTAEVRRVTTLGMIELGGFLIVFTCMILMRFGL
jgi:uncharacterized membrane protein